MVGLAALLEDDGDILISMVTDMPSPEIIREPSLDTTSPVTEGIDEVAVDVVGGAVGVTATRAFVVEPGIDVVVGRMVAFSTVAVFGTALSISTQIL